MSTSKKKFKIVIVTGPTATGKSDLAVLLAKKFNGEVISADSRQVYRGLNIGTGKITKIEMKGVPHHLLDVTDPKEQFSVVRYKELAQEAIEGIISRGKLPILCGGTGFYLSAVADGIISPDVSPNVTLRHKLEKESVEKLHARLKKLDPTRAAAIDPQNKRRLIRAIEIALELGKVPKVKSKPNPRWNFLWVGLDFPNDTLRTKIRTRIVSRIKKGMVAEANRLHGHGLSWKRMDELGLEYRYLGKLLRKEMTREEFLTVLEQKIWQYAKRQRTWFKRDDRIHWFAPNDQIKIAILVENFLKN